MFLSTVSNVVLGPWVDLLPLSILHKLGNVRSTSYLHSYFVTSKKSVMIVIRRTSFGWDQYVLRPFPFSWSFVLERVGSSRILVLVVESETLNSKEHGPGSYLKESRHKPLFSRIFIPSSPMNFLFIGIRLTFPSISIVHLTESWFLWTHI